MNDQDQDQATSDPIDVANEFNTEAEWQSVLKDWDDKGELTPDQKRRVEAAKIARDILRGSKGLVVTPPSVEDVVDLATWFLEGLPEQTQQRPDAEDCNCPECSAVDRVTQALTEAGIEHELADGFNAGMRVLGVRVGNKDDAERAGEIIASIVGKENHGGVQEAQADSGGGYL